MSWLKINWDRFANTWPPDGYYWIHGGDGVSVLYKPDYSVTGRTWFTLDPEKDSL